METCEILMQGATLIMITVYILILILVKESWIETTCTCLGNSLSCNEYSMTNSEENWWFPTAIFVILSLPEGNAASEHDHLIPHVQLSIQCISFAPIKGTSGRHFIERPWGLKQCFAQETCHWTW